VGAGEIAHHPQGEVEILVEERRRRGPLAALPDPAPEADEITPVDLELLPPRPSPAVRTIQPLVPLTTICSSSVRRRVRSASSSIRRETPKWRTVGSITR